MDSLEAIIEDLDDALRTQFFADRARAERWLGTLRSIAASLSPEREEFMREAERGKKGDRAEG